MITTTLITSVLLIVVGIIGYANQDLASTKASWTALIPAFVGAVIGFCGLLSFNPKLRKHAMHFAALVGLVGMLGGFMPLQRQYQLTGELDLTKSSAVAGILMIVICAVYLAFCIKSFIDARRARNSGIPTQS